VEVVPVRRDGRQIATVQGISYARRDTTENLARRLARPEGPGLHVGVLHCNVEGGTGGHANYAPCSLDDLRATRLDYLALGHVHERRILAEGSGPKEPWIVYPGNTQARSPRHGELGAKGAYVVEVQGGRVLAPEFVACDRVRFVELRCAIDQLADLAELEAELRELAGAARDDAEGRSIIVRAELAGRGELHRDLARPGAVDDLLAHLRERAGQLEPFCWWDSLRDSSSPPTDVADLAQRGDFAADLLEVAAALESDASSLDALIDGLVTGAPRPLQLLLDQLGSDSDRRGTLLATARSLALDELGGP
jgi:hypothetical protein